MFRSALRKFLSPKSCAPIRKVATSALRIETLEDRTVPAVYTVGSGYATIQAALNAAAAHNGSDTVVVPAGTYTEALVINDNSAVTLKTSAGATIQAPATVAAPTGARSVLGGAVIDVLSKNVTIDGFTVSAAGSNANAGIRVVDDGSATIKNNTVTGVLAPTTADSGIGIQVGSRLVTGTLGKGTAKVNNNTVVNYLGAGVLVDGAGGSATVKDNTITGRGAANGGLAQYGVQVSYGAGARVEKNAISGNDTGNFGAGIVSAGVFLYEVGAKDVVVAKNDVFGNEDGILVQLSDATCSGGIEIVNNDVYGNTGFAAINVIDSTRVSVSNNDVFCNDTSNGIALGASSYTEVEGNSVHGNAYADGIYVYQGANNEIVCNESYSNGYNGIFVEESVNNLLWNNSTWGNTENGIKVLGGGSNDIWLGDSTCNVLDGILLKDTACNTVVGNALLANGGYGLRLQNADNTFVAFNLICGNDEGSIYIDSASTGTVTIANRVDTPPTREGSTGSTGSCSRYTNSHSHADTDCADIFEHCE